ncbi:MAG: MmcQ/YjbR family DNA-binding protein [Planctomycetota bacterium]
MAVDVETVRATALAFPGASERDHHGFPSFRLGNAVFATLPPTGALNVMLDEGAARRAVHDEPDACTELHWGKRLVGVGVRLDAANEELVEQLLSQAFERVRAKRRR